MDTDRRYGSYNGRPDADNAGAGRRQEEEWPPRRAPPLRRDRYDLDERREGEDDDGRRRDEDNLHLRDDGDKERAA